MSRDPQQLDLFEDGYYRPDVFIAWAKEVMQRHRITQYRLAQEMRVKQPHISRWLKGGRKPQLQTMLRMESALARLIAHDR